MKTNIQFQKNTFGAAREYYYLQFEKLTLKTK
jgi:hypothetical protein